MEEYNRNKITLLTFDEIYLQKLRHFNFIIVTVKNKESFSLDVQPASPLQIHISSQEEKFIIVVVGFACETALKNSEQLNSADIAFATEHHDSSSLLHQRLLHHFITISQK